MTGTPDGKIPVGHRANLGTDLRTTHPFSITTKESPRVRTPSGRHVKLDNGGYMQCTSCHDPHSEFGGTTEGKFLVQPTARGELCVTCHNETLDSSHAISSKPFKAAQDQDASYKTVAEAGCASCHRSHGAATKGQLLKMNETTEVDEDVCLRCHADVTEQGGRDVGRQIAKSSTHRVRGQGKHEDGESPDNTRHMLPEKSLGAARHATCADCHDAHQAKHRPGTAQRISGALDGVWGIDDTGRKVAPAAFEYQVCFKCHADSMNQGNSDGGGGALRVRRSVTEKNLRLAFATNAVSSHPVVAPGKNPDVPSLKAPLTKLTPGSTILCTDCHASDDGPNAGGKGTAGPHGSVYAPLLERNYTTQDYPPESPTAYALCYPCHDRDVLLDPARSAFPLHARHLQNAHAPCSACHNAHGIPALRGSASGNVHLIDFDLNIVRPLSGSAAYTANGPSRGGSCALVCHGQRHDGVKTGRYSVTSGAPAALRR